ncbi:MAG: VOC family protein [Clostridiaceae bacterium]|nr:VOC family protein [Clostridiaceae bacterium]
MAWYDSAVFYHIYPLGLCGCEKENKGVQEHHFAVLREWAKHASDLNFTAIYIGPLFESVGHGYETTDYKKVDCRLGTNQDFREYVEYCHELGIRVIVDGVFNHVGREFFAFQDVREKREQSRYCSWFCNLNFGGNNEYNDGFSYENWGGYNLLVKLNQRNPEVQNYLTDVIRFWVSEFDIDGIRLDAADVLDFDFMKLLRRTANEVKANFWLMGEVIHGDYSRWVNDEMLHAVTNYELHKGLFSGHNDHNYFEIAHSIKRLNDICRGRRLYTFLDNHDVARIASKLNNKEHLPLVTILLYTIYGIPSVYYGSEFGIEGEKRKDSDWNLRPALKLADYAAAEQDNIVTKLCKRLGELKKTYPELTDGAYKELYLRNRQFAYGRIGDEAELITVLNNDDSEQSFEVPVDVASKQVVDLLGDCFEKQSYAELTDHGTVCVTLPANSGTVLYLGRKAAVPVLAETPEDEAEKAPADVSQPQDFGVKAQENPCRATLEGFGIMVNDMKTMISFYRDVLGFAIEDIGQKNNYAYLKKDGVLFILYGRGNFESITSQKYEYVSGLNGHCEIALAVENYAAVDAAFEKTVSLGAKPILPPSLMEWGKKICYIADPEGNLIEIGSFQP